MERLLTTLVKEKYIAKEILKMKNPPCNCGEKGRCICPDKYED